MSVCVFSHENLAIVQNAKNQLESEGIECQVKNEFHGGGGHVGLNIVPIELWVVQDADANKAFQLLSLESMEEDSPDDESPWQCDECGEENEVEFAACWKCQTTRAQ